MYSINSVRRIDSQTVRVSIQCDAKAWSKLRDAGDLGSLYGIDVSNEVYKTYGIKAYNPSVSHNDRARRGVKSIDLFYTDSQWVDVSQLTYAPNVTHVDFQLKQVQSNPILFKPVMRDGSQSIDPPCDIIRVDFKARRRVA